MEHFAGLDVSVNKTSVCIVDDAGRMVREALLSQLQGGRGDRGPDTLQGSIGRARPHRCNIKVRRRYDAGHAL